MSTKTKKVFNWFIVTIICIIFFIALLINYKDCLWKYIFSFCSITFCGIALMIESIYLIRNIKKSHNTTNNKKKFIQAVDTISQGNFLLLAHDVLDHSFELDLKNDPTIFTQVESYEVTIGFSKLKEPAFYIRLMLMSNEMVFLYCQKEGINMCLVSNILQVEKEDEMHFETYHQYGEFKTKILDKIRNLVK